MKKFIVCTMLLLAVVCGTSVAWAAKHNQVKVKIEATQDPIPTKDTSDTTATDASGDATYVDSVDQSSTDDNDATDNTDSDDIDAYGNLINGVAKSPAVSMVMLIPIIGTICGCLLIGLILFLIFYFRYKNRQAKYRLAEKALEAGKPLPEGVFVGEAPSAQQSGVKPGRATNFSTAERDKGIQNTFLGLGLFIFLWAITGSFGVGCIGLLVMFIGIGRWYTSIEHRKDREMMNGFNQPTESTAAPKEDKKDEAVKEETAQQSEDSSYNVKSDDRAAE